MNGLPGPGRTSAAGAFGLLLILAFFPAVLTTAIDMLHPVAMVIMTALAVLAIGKWAYQKFRRW